MATSKSNKQSKPESYKERPGDVLRIEGLLTNGVQAIDEMAVTPKLPLTLAAA